LLVSPDFIASDYCWGKEMQCAMDRHTSGSAVVIPIILRPVDWHTAPFGTLLALPRDGKPVTTWTNRDDAYLDVAQGLREIAKSGRSAAVLSESVPTIPKEEVESEEVAISTTT